MPNYERVENAHLGFFSQPVYYKGKVLKRYKGLLDEKEGAELIGRHSAFIRRIRGMGINIPETQARLQDLNGGKILEIVQERFESGELAGEIAKRGGTEEVLFVTNGILNDALKFLRSEHNGIGFHPTFRNYAVRNGRFYYFDTFPPFGTPDETKDMMIKHAPTRITKLLMVALYPFMGIYTGEYYNPVAMIGGIAKTAVRLRPELRENIRGLLETSLENAEWKQAVLKDTSNPSQNLRWRFAHRLYPT